jgi:hypothetical protein
MKPRKPAFIDKPGQVFKYRPKFRGESGTIVVVQCPCCLRDMRIYPSLVAPGIWRYQEFKRCSRCHRTFQTHLKFSRRLRVVSVHLTS